MKGLQAFVLATLCVFVFSCDEDQETENQLLGTWIAVGGSLADCDDPADNYTESIDCDDQFCLKVKFLSGGKGRYIETFNFDILETEFTYTISGKKVTICPSSCETSQFVISGNNLTLSYLDASQGCTAVAKFEKE